MLDLNQTTLILTATIDPICTHKLKRSNPTERLNDYKKALSLWRQHEFKNIVFIDNSGYDLSVLREVYKNVDHKVTFLSTPRRDKDSHKGKGYGELTMIKYAFDHCEVLSQAPIIIKSSGRVYIKNFSHFINEYVECEIMCNLEKNLSWADSRFFCSYSTFYQQFLFPNIEQLNDDQGFYIEHLLALACHEAMQKKHKWLPPASLPLVTGISGTNGSTLDYPLLKKIRRSFYQKLRNKLLKMHISN